MAVVLCPIGATLSLEINWPAAGRSLVNCSGQAQVRDEASASGTLMLSGTVTIVTSGGDYGNGTITTELAAADTLLETEGSRGFMDIRLEWSDDGEVQYPLTDQWVEIEFSPTITREV